MKTHIHARTHTIENDDDGTRRGWTVYFDNTQTPPHPRRSSYKLSVMKVMVTTSFLHALLVPTTIKLLLV